MPKWYNQIVGVDTFDKIAWAANHQIIHPSQNHPDAGQYIQQIPQAETLRESHRSGKQSHPEKLNAVVGYF